MKESKNCGWMTGLEVELIQRFLWNVESTDSILHRCCLVYMCTSELWKNTIQVTFDIVLLTQSSEVYLHASTVQVQRYCRAIVSEELAQGPHHTVTVLDHNPYSPYYRPSALTGHRATTVKYQTKNIMLTHTATHSNSYASEIREINSY